MSSEPNIKLTERLWGGRPKGWGSSLPNTSQAGTNPQPQGAKPRIITRQDLKRAKKRPLWRSVLVHGLIIVVIVAIISLAAVPLAVG